VYLLSAGRTSPPRCCHRQRHSYPHRSRQATTTCAEDSVCCTRQCRSPERRRLGLNPSFSSP
jgi:hypothetical protein